MNLFADPLKIQVFLTQDILGIFDGPLRNMGKVYNEDRVSNLWKFVGPRSVSGGPAAQSAYCTVFDYEQPRQLNVWVSSAELGRKSESPL